MSENNVGNGNKLKVMKSDDINIGEPSSSLKSYFQPLKKVQRSPSSDKANVLLLKSCTFKELSHGLFLHGQEIDNDIHVLMRFIM